RAAIVLIRNADGKTLQLSSHSKRSDELNGKAFELIKNVPELPTFGSKLRTHGYVAWVPMHGENWNGGLVIESRDSGDCLTEEEMEYLTVVGGITNSALARIRSKEVEPIRVEQ